MKKLLFIILFPFLLSAQSSGLIMLFGGEESFDPLTFDANTIALYDGNEGLSTATWEDQTTNENDISFDNTPTVTSGAIGGLNAILLDGVNQDGRVDFTWTQPKTVYFVMKQVGWALADRMFGAYATANANYIIQDDDSPEIKAFSGANGGRVGLTVGTYFILTFVFNGASSLYRFNGTEVFGGNLGTNDASGITIGAKASGASDFANIEIAFMILRDSADDNDTMALFEAYLSNRSGIALD